MIAVVILVAATATVLTLTIGATAGTAGSSSATTTSSTNTTSFVILVGVKVAEGREGGVRRGIEELVRVSHMVLLYMRQSITKRIGRKEGR